MPKAVRTEIPELRKTTGSPVLGSVGAAGSQYEGLANIGAAGMETARVVQSIEDRKQRLTDAAGSSDNYINAKQTQKKIDAELAENRNNHEEWDKIPERHWEKHFSELNADLESGGYTPEAKQKILAEAKLMRQESTAAVKEKKSARGWELKYTSVVMKAEDLARNDRNKEAEDEIKTLGLEEEEEKALIKKTLQYGHYSDAQFELQGLQTMPEVGVFMEALFDKDSDGNFINWTEMDLPGRKRLRAYADAKIKTASKSDGYTMLSLQEKLYNGTVDDMDFKQAELKGIPEKDLEQLKGLYETQVAYEEDTAAYKRILNTIDGRWWEKKNTSSMPWNRLNQNEDDQWWTAQVRAIQKEKLLKVSKRKLMDELIVAWKADVSDGEMELSQMKDRRLSETERKFHEDLFDVYRDVNAMGILSPAVLGGSMKNNLYDFSKWYDKHQEDKDFDEQLKKKMDGYQLNILGTYYDRYQQMKITREMSPEAQNVAPKKTGSMY